MEHCAVISSVHRCLLLLLWKWYLVSVSLPVRRRYAPVHWLYCSTVYCKSRTSINCQLSLTRDKRHHQQQQFLPNCPCHASKASFCFIAYLGQALELDVCFMSSIWSSSTNKGIIHNYHKVASRSTSRLGAFHKLRLHLGWVGGQKNVQFTT